MVNTQGKPHGMESNAILPGSALTTTFRVSGQQDLRKGLMMSVEHKDLSV
jgi:hypothetical protein